jgi:hypothetical protein
MDIQEYFSKLNSDSQKVFSKTILEKEKLGTPCVRIRGNAMQNS